jgi:hypothetical protein
LTGRYVRERQPQFNFDTDRNPEILNSTPADALVVFAVGGKERDGLMQPARAVVLPILFREMSVRSGHFINVVKSCLVSFPKSLNREHRLQKQQHRELQR